MALRRITIDIEDWGQGKNGSPRFGVAITASGEDRIDSDGIKASKVQKLVKQAVDRAIFSITETL